MPIEQNNRERVRDLTDDILWNDCPEELYLQRILREHHEDEGTFTDSLMGRSTLDGIFQAGKAEKPSTTESNDGKSWIRFAPLAGSVATEGTITAESSPSFVETVEGGTAPGAFVRNTTIQNQPMDVAAKDRESVPFELNPRFLNFDEESLTITLPERHIPDIVDTQAPYDDGVTETDGTRAGFSTLSGDTWLKNAQWWINSEDINYANKTGFNSTPTTKSSTLERSNNNCNRREGPKTERHIQGESTRSTERAREGCFSWAIRSVTEDEKVFRRTVVISVLFILIFVTLSAVALVRAGGIEAFSSASSQATVPTSSPTSPISGQEPSSSTGQQNAVANYSPTELTPSPSVSPHHIPTQPPNQAYEDTSTFSPTYSGLAADPFQIVQNIIVQQSPPSTPALGNQRSPQYRALQWSADDLRGSLGLSDERILQRWALAVLFFSLNGEFWFNRDGWLTGENECLWFSSSSESVCDELGRFMRLELEANSLQGSLPDELGLLSDSLTEVNISKNQISGSIPTIIGVLESLRHLSIRQNMLMGSIPSQLVNLNALKLLDLTENDLTGTLPQSWSGLSDLDSLALSDNRLIGTVPVDIALIPTLVLLELSSNDLTGTMPPEMCEKRNNGLGVLTIDCSEVSCTCCDAC